MLCAWVLPSACYHPAPPQLKRQLKRHAWGVRGTHWEPSPRGPCVCVGPRAAATFTQYSYFTRPPRGLRWDSHRIWGAEGVVPRSHRAARRRACGAQLSQRGARGTASAYPVRPTHRCCSGAARAPGGRAAVQDAHRCGSSARTAPRLQPAVQGLHRSGSSACSAQCVRRRCVLVHRSLSSARTAPERRLHVHEKVQQLLVRGCPHGS